MAHFNETQNNRNRYTMDIGIPKENGTTNLERRAILLPKEVSKLIEAGHNVFVEKGLGGGIYINDDEYKEAGADLVASKRDIFNKSIVVKLKPPLPQEFKLLGNLSKGVEAIFSKIGKTCFEYRLELETGTNLG